MPSQTTIETMWYNNPDGAGFMYAKGGKVFIEKGFMDLQSFVRAIDSLDKSIDIVATPLIMHFRITTSGGTTPENTHPFPVSDSLKQLQRTRCTAPLAIAHNGMINIKPSSKVVSDTMEYVTAQLSLLYKLREDFYTTKTGKELVYNAIQSKMAFLDKAGRIETVGKFHELNGILYSNYSYQPYKGYYTWDIWDEYLLEAEIYDKMPLSWIDEDGYVITDTGSIIEGYDCLVDKYGKTYCYDWNDNVCREIAASAFTAQGLPQQFNESTVEFMTVAAKASDWPERGVK